MGSAARRHSSSSAAGRPRSTSSGGLMPWVSSRSSSSATARASRVSRSSGLASPSCAGSLDSSSPSDIAIDTSRCWVPSCRSRSIRRRSASVAPTSRARDACRSTSRARSSACRRSFSSARLAAAHTDCTSSASSSRNGSCSSAAIGWPSRSTSVARRPPSLLGEPHGRRRRRRRSSARPGTRRRAPATGHPGCGPAPGAGRCRGLGVPSSTTSPATPPRASWRWRNTNITAIGTVAVR